MSPGTTPSGRSFLTMSAYFPFGTKQISWLSGLSAIARPRRSAWARVSSFVRLPRGSGENSVAPAWWRTENNSDPCHDWCPGEVPRNWPGHALDVMSRCQCVRLQVSCARQKIPKFYGLIAFYTRDRCFTGQVSIGKIIMTSWRNRSSKSST